MVRIPVALRIGAAITATTAFYGYLGQIVPQVEIHPPEAIEIELVPVLDTKEMIERGLDLFEGKGLCSTCHTRGDRPISPAFPDLSDIGARAGDRIPGMSALDYLSHSLYEPRVFVVPGYAPSMPEITQPPIGLAEEEIRSVIAYLQSLGGELTVTASTKLPVVLREEQIAAIRSATDPLPGSVTEQGVLLADAEDREAATGGTAVKLDTGSVPASVEVVSADSSPRAGDAARLVELEADADTPGARGSLVYGRICAACHGAAAEGNVLFNAPRLAGQESWYVTRQLKNFAEGIRGADPADVYGLQMRPMAMVLQGDEEIADVAAFLSSIE